MTAQHSRTARSCMVTALLGGAARGSKSAPAVISPPLAADATVSAKQALSVSAQMRRAFTLAVARPLASTADGDKRAGK